jgi:uncharacterized protein (TIGR04255 family)
MDVHKYHPRAPITEAVLDIRVDLEGGGSLEKLAQIGAAWADSYPNRRNFMTMEAHFSADPEVEVSKQHSQSGYLFQREDGLQTVNLGLDGFSFSRLRPYTNWEEFSGEARRLWTIYREQANVVAVKRIAVRYINRLDLPLYEGFDFKDYLRTVPEVSPEMPQGLKGYFMQLQVPLAEIMGVVIVNQAMLEPPTENVASVLLDLDYFRTHNVPQDEGALWEAFGQLRVVKNRIFEACITERARRLID